MTSEQDAIGGYFGLELPIIVNQPFPGSFRFNSARSAFAFLIETLAIEEVWLPRYLCNSMVDVLSDKNAEIKFYSLTEDFSVKDGIHLASKSIILCVNYYGLCSNQVKNIINEYRPENVVVDNSQALFAEKFESIATLYSPRKFFGLPDGGLLYSDDSRLLQPEKRDDSSESRLSHLIGRLTNAPEEGYQKYLEAEETISEMPVLAMSELTERLLQSIDYEKGRNSRCVNASRLDSKLGHLNKLNLELTDGVAPLCYPLLPKKDLVKREELIKNRVFVPCYWPEVLDRVSEYSFEWNLVTNGLFLPCDQRYSEKHMDYIATLLDSQ